MIYLLGNFSGRILKFLGLINLDLSLFLILTNVIIGLSLGLYSFYQVRKLENENVMEVKAEWS